METKIDLINETIEIIATQQQKFNEDAHTTENESMKQWYIERRNFCEGQINGLKLALTVLKGGN